MTSSSFLRQSKRIDIVTYDENGNEVDRVCYKDYGTSCHRIEVEMIASSLELEPNQKAVVVCYIDGSNLNDKWTY